MKLMKGQTELILITPGQLIDHINIAIMPILDRLEAVEKKLAQERISYTAIEMGKLFSVSSRTIRQWILVGKVDSKGKRHYLNAVELVRGRHTILLSDMKIFVDQFR